MARLFGRRRQAEPGGAANAETVRGAARIDRRTKDLVHRLRPRDVAVIDHRDLDRIAAEGLVEAQPGAVLNAAESSSGRYPNEGPLLLLEAAARVRGR